MDGRGARGGDMVRDIVLDGIHEGDHLHGLPLAAAAGREGGTTVWLGNLYC